MTAYACVSFLMRYFPRSLADDRVEFSVICRSKTGKLRVRNISLLASTLPPTLTVLIRDGRVCLLYRDVLMNALGSSDIRRIPLDDDADLTSSHLQSPSGFAVKVIASTSSIEVR